MSKEKKTNNDKTRKSGKKSSKRVSTIKGAKNSTRLDNLRVVAAYKKIEHVFESLGLNPTEILTTLSYGVVCLLEEWPQSRQTISSLFKLITNDKIPFKGKQKVKHKTEVCPHCKNSLSVTRERRVVEGIDTDDLSEGQLAEYMAADECGVDNDFCETVRLFSCPVHGVIREEIGG
jgi:hypothetical protein